MNGQTSLFYNTTGESGETLKENRRKATSQDEVIYRHLKAVKNAGASDVFRSYPKWPITSIRRSLNSLSSQGLIIKSNDKQKGLYGRSEYIYRIEP